MRIDSLGNIIIKGSLKLKNDTWHTSIDNINRLIKCRLEKDEINI